MFKSKGFTLIELLVVMGIVLLLSFGIVAGLSVTRQKKQARATAEKLRDYLNEARSMAMMPDDTALGLEKIQVRIYNEPTNKVELHEISSSGTQLISEFDIPKGITIGDDMLHPPSKGNMECDGACGNTDYYYFSYNAGDPSESLFGIGQVLDFIDANFPISISVIGAETYNLVINLITGLIEISEP